MKTLVLLTLLAIHAPQNIITVLHPGTIVCMDGIQVVIVQFLPYGLDVGDLPRYEVVILGTCKNAYPFVTSIKEVDDNCIQLNDDDGCN